MKKATFALLTVALTMGGCEIVERQVEEVYAPPPAAPEVTTQPTPRLPLPSEATVPTERLPTVAPEAAEETPTTPEERPAEEAETEGKAEETPTEEAPAPSKSIAEVPKEALTKPEEAPPAAEVSPAEAAPPEEIRPPVEVAKAPGERTVPEAETTAPVVTSEEAAKTRPRVPETEVPPTALAAPPETGEVGEAEEQAAGEQVQQERQRQDLTALRFHLARVRDFLQGDSLDLARGQQELELMRRALSFLRADLSEAATLHQLACALALLQAGELEAAQRRLQEALTQWPKPTEPKTEAPAPSEATPPSATEPTAPEPVPSTEATETVEPLPTEEPREPTVPEQIEAVLEQLKANQLAEAQKHLAQVLYSHPRSEAEMLIEALTAEVDYAAAALERASRRAAEVELESLEGNLERLEELLLGKPLTTTAEEAPPAEEEASPPEAETTETEAETTSSAPAPISSGLRTLSRSGIPTSWLWPGAGVLGMLAFLGIWFGWRRKAGPRKP